MDAFQYANSGNMTYGGSRMGRSPSETLAEYMDCPCRLIPAGSGINDVNQKYLSVLRYCMEHGSTPLLIPVSDRLVSYLVGGMGLNINQVRQSRRSMLWEMNDASGERIVSDSYQQKAKYMAYKGVNMNDFENSGIPGVAVNCFSSFISSGRTNCDVLLAQVPTGNPWEAFVWLPIGGLNGAPDNKELVAVSRRWNELCGAVPAVIGYGVAEYFVPRGKPDRQTAMEIAKGHFAVCPERALCMTQSHTVSELADTLTKSCVWYIGWKE
ncbi:MAG: DUF4253 domain-containing protein [Clostridia bacterium]|nr:DUF4253 domain-containing protein [Clostridia bacterium]MBQ1555627.1 DUF4253 domain-containing protein [Clostridia bacterium]MBQ5544130.1 DUF4253 domain-containing protein [Clostridia bacterium]